MTVRPPWLRASAPPSLLAAFLLLPGCMEYQLVSLEDTTPELVGPLLLITPSSYDFGTGLLTCSEELDVELANIGGDTLEIYDLDYASFGMLDFDDRGLALPLSLEPGETVTVGVIFEPDEAGTDQGILAVTSNDPRTLVLAEQQASSIQSASITESFTSPGQTRVDVLWTIDQSRSMEEDNQDDIREGVPGLLDALGSFSDYHLIQVTRDTGCTNVGVLTETSPDAEDLLIDNAFASNRNQQSTTEQLLAQAETALQQTVAGGCNEGFLRPGALLHIIVASDEEDQSPYDHDYWLDRYASHLTEPDRLVVSAVVDTGLRCGDGSGPGEYLEAANATGGNVLDICGANWGQRLGDLATDVLIGEQAYDLAHAADPDSLVVRVNGVVTYDFTYSESGRTVTVESPAVDGGDIVDIAYDALVTCR